MPDLLPTLRGLILDSEEDRRVVLVAVAGDGIFKTTLQEITLAGGTLGQMQLAQLATQFGQAAQRDCNYRGYPTRYMILVYPSTMKYESFKSAAFRLQPTGSASPALGTGISWPTTPAPVPAPAAIPEPETVIEIEAEPEPEIAPTPYAKKLDFE